jgi:putative FmdB family regulatory protein
MPVYEYECQDCDKQFEVFQSIKDNPLKNCKFCEGKVRRLISQSSFALKGGGWYKDNYSKGGSKEKKTPDKAEPAPKIEKKDPKGPQSKPESKAG